MMIAILCFLLAADLDAEVKGIFAAKCAICHDDLKGSAGGDVDYLLDFAKLADPENGYFDPEAPKDSYLRALVEDGSMPKKKYRKIPFGGELTAAEKDTVFRWIDGGGLEEHLGKQAAGGGREIITEEAKVQLIAADLLRLGGAELKHARYLHLVNWHNHVGTTDATLATYRQGLVKMLNSLSREPDVLGLDTSEAVNRLVAVDEARTIFRFDLRHIGWNAGEWDRVARHTPYAIERRQGTGKVVYTLTGSPLPYLRADWFTFATSQPPLYHDLVGIPKRIADLDRRLGVDRMVSIGNRTAKRAGFANSGVSVNNRIVERIPMRGGYYHISDDAGSNSGDQYYFQNPLGPKDARLSGDKAYQQDGGEIIFSLPNGFQGYALLTGAGDRLSIGPDKIVYDNSMPGGNIVNGISCIACHYQGMKPENRAARLTLDKIRGRSLANNRQFSAAEQELIAELYPEGEEFAGLLDRDRKQFLDALEEAGITETGPDEPVRMLFDAFAENLTPEVAAAELGMTPEAFVERMKGESELRDVLMQLEGESVQRPLWVDRFRLIVRLLGMGDAHEFRELKVPYFGFNPDAPAQAAAAEPRVDLLEAQNTSGPLKLTAVTEGSRQHYDDGEAMRCELTASRDCFVTLLAVDPAGEVTVLAPNEWQPSLRLTAGRTVTVPTPAMGFDIVAQPPHGPTILRAIATVRPLEINGVNAGGARPKGLASLGNRDTIRDKGFGAVGRPARPGTSGASAATVTAGLTDRLLAEQFAPDEWATAQWTLVTHP